MVGALIILLVTVCIGLVLYVYDLKYRRRHPGLPTAEAGDEEASGEAEEPHGEICCGRHLICEKSLSPLPGEKAEYYDDEELDRFAGRSAGEYAPEEVEEVREVMMTLLPSDIPGWVRSLQLRGIEVPEPLRDELIILLDNS